MCERHFQNGKIYCIYLNSPQFDFNFGDEKCTNLHTVHIVVAEFAKVRFCLVSVDPILTRVNSPCLIGICGNTSSWSSCQLVLTRPRKCVACEISVRWFILFFLLFLHNLGSCIYVSIPYNNCIFSNRDIINIRHVGRHVECKSR